MCLPDELFLEPIEELEGEPAFQLEGLLAHHGLHRHGLLAEGVLGVELVGDVPVVVRGPAGPDGALHEPAERGEHVDGGVHLLVVQGPVDVDLPLRDVPGEVGDRVRDVVVGHREDGDLRDGPPEPLDAPGPLVQRGQVRVHVPGIPPPAGHLLPGGTDLPEGVRVRAHVRHDHEHVLALLVGEVLRGGEGKARSDDSLYGGVVRQVEEQHRALQGPRRREGVLEEPRRLHVHSHRREHDHELRLLVPLPDQARLSADLRRHLVVGEAAAREDGDLLSPGDRVHHVDRRDPRLDHLLGIRPALRVDRLPLDVQVRLRDYLRAPVYYLAAPVEHPPQHVQGHSLLQEVPLECHVGLLDVDARRALEHLDHRLVRVDLQHLARPPLLVRQRQRDHLRVLQVVHVLQDHQRAVHTRNPPIRNCRVDFYIQFDIFHVLF